MNLQSFQLLLLLSLCWVPVVFVRGWQRWLTIGKDFARKSRVIFGIGGVLLNCPFPSFAVETASPTSIVTAPKQSSQKYYFGLGCFWHVQHEFVEKEKNLLQRSDNEITSVVGYAGGTGKQKDGLVCYHNNEGVEDYSKLGHAEVVTVDFPIENFKDFNELYLSLFSPSLDRPDIGDRGAEYRSLIGLPGGVKNEKYAILKELAQSKGLILKEGRGNDGDTLGKRVVWVMDSNKFAFNQGETFHQFHDGFMPDERYPASYNGLIKSAFTRGLIHPTGCPAEIQF